jgi:hypothetical protein
MRYNNQRGEVITAVVLAIALLGGAFLWFKPKAAHGESRRAAQSAETTADLNAAYVKREAVASAYVQKSGEVVGSLPESREKTFLEQANSIAKANLPAPDPMALLAAERLKNATLEGKLDVASKLYDSALKNSDKLNKELEQAKAAKQEADVKLGEAAAANLASERQRNRLIMIAGALGLLWLYTHFTRPSPGAIATAINDMKAGIPPVQALDGVTTRLEQFYVRLMAKLKS